MGAAYAPLACKSPYVNSLSLIGVFARDAAMHRHLGQHLHNRDVDRPTLIDGPDRGRPWALPAAVLEIFSRHVRAKAPPGISGGAFAFSPPDRT